jgi:hypothetical protein
MNLTAALFSCLLLSGTIALLGWRLNVIRRETRRELRRRSDELRRHSDEVLRETQQRLLAAAEAEHRRIQSETERLIQDATRERERQIAGIRTAQLRARQMEAQAAAAQRTAQNLSDAARRAGVSMSEFGLSITNLDRSGSLGLGAEMDVVRERIYQGLGIPPGQMNVAVGREDYRTVQEALIRAMASLDDIQSNFDVENIRPRGAPIHAKPQPEAPPNPPTSPPKSKMSIIMDDE